MPLLSKPFLIFANQLSCIIKIFYIIPLILFWVVAGPINKTFKNWALTFLIIYLLSKWSYIRRGVNISGSSKKSFWTAQKMTPAILLRKLGGSLSYL